MQNVISFFFFFFEIKYDMDMFMWHSPNIYCIILCSFLNTWRDEMYEITVRISLQCAFVERPWSHDHLPHKGN